MKEAILWFLYYGSFLCFPFLLGMLWLMIKTRYRWLAAGLLSFTLFFIYCRFIEPQIIVIREEASPVAANFVLISDMHLGTYKRTPFMQRVANNIKSLDADFVIIPGDWVYGIELEKIPQLFEPFSDLDIPIYGVLGNHDLAPAGELNEAEGKQLIETLQANGVQLIDNQWLEHEGIQIAGLGELWNNDVDVSSLAELDPEKDTLIVGHNPDFAYLVESMPNATLFAGHTHGGQVRLPWIYKSVIPTKYDWDDGQGWYEVNENKLYITSGLGEIGLPLRLGVPPEIVYFVQ